MGVAVQMRGYTADKTNEKRSVRTGRGELANRRQSGAESAAVTGSPWARIGGYLRQFKLNTRTGMSFLVPGYCGLLFFATFWASWDFAGLHGASPVQFESSR